MSETAPVIEAARLNLQPDGSTVWYDYVTGPLDPENYDVLGNLETRKVLYEQ